MAKKKKKKKLYNKKQFKNIFCNKCRLCNGKPTFCYTDVYRNYPKLFTKDIFERLLEVKDWNKDKKRNTLGPEEFRYAFCMVLMLSCNPYSNFDDIEARMTLCHRLRSCYDKFVDQQIGKKGKRLIKINRKKKRSQRRKNSRYVCEPYPTIIMSDNPEWKEFIKGLFDNGNNVDEQDTDKGTACKHQGASDQ